MKLKKIASLMLAGIMAVSMLAGCKGAASSEQENPEVVPVVGVAAAVNAELDENKDKVSFTEDKAVENLLKNYYTENPIDKDDWTGAPTTVTVISGGEPVVTLNDYVGADTVGLSNIKNSTDDKFTACEMYMMSSKYLEMNDALKLVGQYLDDVELPEENTAKDKDNSYTGKIAAVEAESKGGTESVYVIFVSITKTAAAK